MKSFLSIFAAVGLLGINAGAQMVTSHQPSSVAASAASPKQDSKISSSLLHATGKPVVKVNGTVLTDRDLVHELYVIFPYAQLHSGIPKDMEPEMRRGAMAMIIFDELVYQEALRRKMTVPETKYEEARQHFMKQFADGNAFNAFLAQECKGSKEEFRRKLMRSLLIEALVKQEVTDKATPTEAQLRKAYDLNAKKFDRTESFSFQSISVIPPENATADMLAEAKKRAKTVLTAAKATKSYQEFGLLAEKYSEDDFRVNMGDHKAVERTKLPPEFVKAALSMKPGDVSDLIVLGPDYTIFRLNAHVAAGRASFEEAKPKLRDELEKTKTEQLRKNLYTKLRQTAKVQEI